MHKRKSSTLRQREPVFSYPTVIDCLIEQPDHSDRRPYVPTAMQRGATPQLIPTRRSTPAKKLMPESPVFGSPQSPARSTPKMGGAGESPDPAHAAQKAATHGLSLSAVAQPDLNQAPRLKSAVVGGHHA